MLADDPEPLRFLLTRSWERSADAFARLNAALAGDGMVLRVAKGAVIRLAIEAKDDAIVTSVKDTGPGIP
ncbi:MAG: hypothetical protein P8Z69_03240, partial [Acidihalobacter sp.]